MGRGGEFRNCEAPFCGCPFGAFRKGVFEGRTRRTFPSVRKRHLQLDGTRTLFPSVRKARLQSDGAETAGPEFSGPVASRRTSPLERLEDRPGELKGSPSLHGRATTRPLLAVSAL
jgi:hypothetical protein